MKEMQTVYGKRTLIEYSDYMRLLIKKCKNNPYMKIVNHNFTEGGFHLEDENGYRITTPRTTRDRYLYVIFFRGNKEKFIAYVGTTKHFRSRIYKFLKGIQDTLRCDENHPAGTHFRYWGLAKGYSVNDLTENLYVKFQKLEHGSYEDMPNYLDINKMDESLAYLLGSQFNTKIIKDHNLTVINDNLRLKESLKYKKKIILGIESNNLQKEFDNESD